MLDYNPQNRKSADELLQHPWLIEDKTDEVVLYRSPPPILPLFNEEKERRRQAELQVSLLAEEAEEKAWQDQYAQSEFEAAEQIRKGIEGQIKAGEEQEEERRWREREEKLEMYGKRNTPRSQDILQLGGMDVGYPLQRWAK